MFLYLNEYSDIEDLGLNDVTGIKCILSEAIHFAPSNSCRTFGNQYPWQDVPKYDISIITSMLRLNHLSAPAIWSKTYVVHLVCKVSRQWMYSTPQTVMVPSLSIMMVGVSCSSFSPSLFCSRHIDKPRMKIFGRYHTVKQTSIGR